MGELASGGPYQFSRCPALAAARINCTMTYITSPNHHPFASSLSDI